MSGVKTDLAKNVDATKVPFQATASIPDSDVERAINRIQNNLSAAQILVAAAAANLPAALVATNANAITWQFGSGTVKAILGALTGDVTTPGADSLATTIAALAVTTGKIAAAAVTYAKIQNESASTLLGNPTGNAAAPSEITLGAALAFVGAALQTVAMTGDVTTAANSFATAIAANAVTTAKIAAAAVTYAKLQNESASTLLGNPTGSAAAPSEITLGAALAFVGAALQTVAMTGDVTTAANSFATTIAANAVTNAKFRQGAALSVVGVTGNATANVADIAGTAAQVLRVNDAGNALAFGQVDLSQAAAVTGQLVAGSMPALTGAVQSAGGTLATTETIDLVFVIGSGQAVIPTGITPYWSAPFDFACTIVAWSIVADESGSISIDVLKTTFGNFDAGATHPVIGDKISASAPITFSTATKAQSSTLTGWTTAVSVNDILAFNVASVTSCKQVTINLKVTKTS